MLNNDGSDNLYVLSPLLSYGNRYCIMCLFSIVLSNCMIYDLFFVLLSVSASASALLACTSILFLSNSCLFYLLSLSTTQKKFYFYSL